jgi:hypothetical protein
MIVLIRVDATPFTVTKDETAEADRVRRFTRGYDRTVVRGMVIAMVLASLFASAWPAGAGTRATTVTSISR